MKTSIRVLDQIQLVALAVVMGLLSGCTAYQEQPRTQVSAQPPPPQPAAVHPGDSVIHSNDDFIPLLAPYGRWAMVGSAGRCWIPNPPVPGWQPYSNGYWQYTDAGWYWVGLEPWSWATDHYGCWDSSPEIGWYWVPQTEWAAARVIWRAGGGYIGWAPQAKLSDDGYAEADPSAMAPHFVFVEERRLLEPIRPTAVIVVNMAIINQTASLTNTRTVNQNITSEGPSPEAIEAARGRKLQPVLARVLRRRQEAVLGKLSSNHELRQTDDPKAADRIEAARQARQSEIEADQRFRQELAARQAEEQKAAAAKIEDLKRQTQADLDADRRARQDKEARQTDQQ